MLQDGVIRQIEIIGEAVRHLSPGLRERHSSIPWDDIAGMREQLIHGYFGVDLQTVWDTAKHDIPSFRAEITKILDEF